MRCERKIWAAFAVTLVIAAPAAFAADRALLIGIGHYGRLSPLPSVPGIDVDLTNMEQVVDIMGFAPVEVRVLRDQDASAAAIREAIRTWLIAGTRPGDRALLYFTGHGSQVEDRDPRDEADGLDEVLVAYDVRLDLVEGRLRASGVLTDDDLYGLLNQLVDRNVLVLLDACNSGTATRGGGETLPEGWIRKGANLEGVRPKPTTGPDWTDPHGVQRWVTLAAADDDESATATPYGSPFTQAVHEEVLDGRSARALIPLPEFRDQVAEYLTDRSHSSSPLPVPVLSGPASLHDKGIRLVQPDARGPVRRQLEGLQNRPGTNLLQASQRDYSIGEGVRLDVVPQQAGYLNLIAVDSDDHAYVLFPNCFQPDNRVKAGARYRLGDARTMGFSMTADDPAGETYLLAIFTSADQPLNFYREALAEFGVARGTRCQPPDADSAIWRLSTHAVLRAKGIRITAPADAYVAQGLTINVRDNPESEQ